MPRRGRFGYRARRFGSVPRRPRAPKPPKQPKVPRPKTKDLRMILKGLVTTDQGQRISTLLYALKWYDDAVLYLTFAQKGQLTPEQRKRVDLVHKTRLQGQGTSFNDEKETAYRTAVKILERVMDDTFTPKDSKTKKPTGPSVLPKVDTFYKALEQKKPTLEKKTENWTAKFGSTIDMISKALLPKNAAGNPIQISIGPVQEEVQKDPELKSFVIRPDIAKQVHRKRLREGLLSAVMEPVIIEELARLASMEKEMDQNQSWTGRWLAMGGKQRTAVVEMIRNLTTFAKTPEAPKRLVRVAPAEPVNGDGTPRPRPVRVGFGGRVSGPLVDGLFIEGSTAGLLWVILKDGKTYTKKDLRTKIGKQAINESLKKMTQVLAGKGGKMEVSGEKVTVTPPPATGGN